MSVQYLPAFAHNKSPFYNNRYLIDASFVAQHNTEEKVTIPPPIDYMHNKQHFS